MCKNATVQNYIIASLQEVVGYPLSKYSICAAADSSHVALIKKKRRAAREYLAHVHNRSVWQGGPSRRAAATANAFFLLPVRRPSVSLPDLCSAAVVLIWQGRKERGEVGIGLNL